MMHRRGAEFNLPACQRRSRLAAAAARPNSTTSVCPPGGALRIRPAAGEADVNGCAGPHPGLRRRLGARVGLLRPAQNLPCESLLRLKIGPQ